MPPRNPSTRMRRAGPGHLLQHPLHLVRIVRQRVDLVLRQHGAEAIAVRIGRDRRRVAADRHALVQLLDRSIASRRFSPARTRTSGIDQRLEPGKRDLERVAPGRQVRPRSPPPGRRRRRRSRVTAAVRSSAPFTCTDGARNDRAARVLDDDPQRRRSAGAARRAGGGADPRRSGERDARAISLRVMCGPPTCQRLRRRTSSVDLRVDLDLADRPLLGGRRRRSARRILCGNLMPSTSRQSSKNSEKSTIGWRLHAARRSASRRRPRSFLRSSSVSWRVASAAGRGAAPPRACIGPPAVTMRGCGPGR